MKKLFSLLFVAIATTFAFAARTFDGTEKIYLKANAVSWWTDGNAVQRAVLDNTTSVIGVVESGAVYSFTIPAGDFSTIRFERAETAEAEAWNATGNIAIPAEGNYVTAFNQNSTEATWETYVYTPPTVVLKGGFNNWGNADVFSDNGENATFTKTIAKGSYGFKITVDGGWRSNYTTIGRANSGEGYDFSSNPMDATLDADMDGEYTFTFTYATNFLSVTFPTEEVEIDPTFALHGNFSNPDTWADTEGFVLADDKATASLTMHLTKATYEFGAKVNGAWRADGTAFTRDNTSAEVKAGSANNTLYVDLEGDYTFVWTFATNTLSITYPEGLVIPEVLLRGGFNDWGEEDAFVDAEDHLSASLTKLFSKGDITFKITVDNSWKSNNITIERANSGEGYDFSANNDIDATLRADKSGNYTFIYTYVTKQLSVTFPEEEIEVIPTIKLHGNFSDPDVWADTEGFVLADDKATASRTISIPAVGDYQFGVKINGTWTSNGVAFTRENTSAEVGAGGDNCTLKADAVGDYTFTWTFADNTLSVTYPSLSTQTLYFVNDGEWTTQQAFVYQGSANYKTWPGEVMAATEDKVFGKDVYSYTFPSDYTMIIFNNKLGEEGEQSADLAWSSDKPYYFRGVWYASLEDIANTFFITGSASLVGENEWQETAVKVTESSYTFENLQEDYYELKVVYGGEWLGFGNLASVPAGVRTTEITNIAFYLAEAGNVTVAFDKSTREITISGPFAHLDLDEAIDNTTAISALDGIYVPIALTRSFEAQKLYTLCLPFDVNAADVTDVLHAEKLYKLKSTAIADSELEIYFDIVDAIEAGVPYLYQPDADVVNPAFFATVDASAETTISAGAVTMTGFYQPTTTSGYFLGDDTYLHKSTATAKAFRAYFAISAGAAHLPARVVMRGSGEQGTTELEKVQRDQEPSTKVIRNGQLVIIRDGKTYDALGTELK